MHEPVRYEVRNRIAVVTLNRHEKLKAFSGAMAERLACAHEQSDHEKVIGKNGNG